jgi:hypothetical protein
VLWIKDIFVLLQITSISFSSISHFFRLYQTIPQIFFISHIFLSSYSLSHLFLSSHFLSTTKHIVNSIDNLVTLCDRGWSKQCGEVVLAGFINIVDIIWYCRNQARFHNKFFNFHIVVNHICFNVNIIGYFLKCTSSTSIHEFQILKAFSIELHAHAPKIKEVYWYPPKHYWIKCNEETALNWLFRLGCMQRFI